MTIYPSSKPSRLVAKRCQKCGSKAFVKPREVRCKQRCIQGWKGSYLCWGKLLRPLAKRVTATSDIHARGERYRAAARKTQATAERNVGRWFRAIAKAQRLMAKWEKRALSAANQVAKTDEEIERLRATREKALATGRQVQAAHRRLVKAAGVPMQKLGGRDADHVSE
jgi:DNA-directed RNA polymerase subunit RPC12/RpoP